MMVVTSWTSERLVYRITSRADAENVVAALSDLKTSESIYWVPKPGYPEKSFFLSFWEGYRGLRRLHQPA